MVGLSSANPLRTAGRILFALALTVATQSINAAAAQNLVEFSEYGSVSGAPSSDSPKGCLKAAKTLCTGTFMGTTRSTLFTGVGQNRGTSTIDFGKPEASGVGVCFPFVVSGIVHTAHGDYKFVEQGPGCVPPSSAKLAPGFYLQLRSGLLTGLTGAFAHLFATYSVSVSISPSGLTIFRHVGVASGIKGDSM